MVPQPAALTFRGWQTAVWILVASLQYGWHISALNQIQAVLTCRSAHNNSLTSLLPSCIPMDDLSFSLVTSSFTVGGLLGSIAATRSMESLGRKFSTRINAVLILLGSTLMGLSASVPTLVFGRFLIGVGSGLGLCVVPAYLSEISPPAIKGSVGVLNQLGIVFGILLTQALGIVLAAPSLWRLIPLIASALALAQLLLSFLAVDSPAWLVAKAQIPEAKRASALLWGDPSLIPIGGSSRSPSPNSFHRSRTTPSDDTLNEEEGLLTSSHSYQTPDEDSGHSVRLPPTLHQLLRPPLLRPLIIVCLGMFSQQISGINAVLYYSNDILSRVLPESAAYVSLGVTVVNVIMTFPPIYLIERIGRRSLITLSVFGAVLSLAGVGYGLNEAHVMLASISVLTFVASFAIGLGPVPFVIIPDVSPYHAVSTLSSIALSLNWVTNFIVGIGFLPLRNLLAGAGGDSEHRQGRVFYVFAGVLSVVYVAWSKAYRGR